MKYRGLIGRTARRRCPHSNLASIYGDAINATYYGWRLWCLDCERYISGPVVLAESRRDESRALRDLDTPGA